MYAVHPWLGGDFNPFEGADVCPWSTSASPRLCPCVCQPQSACNMGNSTTDIEFPSNIGCAQMRVPSTVLFDEGDWSDVCHMAKRLATKQPATSCVHPQGLFGGMSELQAYSVAELDAWLHSPSGRPVAESSLYDEVLLSGTATLWGGGTLFDANPYMAHGFLRMPPADLHPAHVAFGFGPDSATLQVRALGLRRDRVGGGDPSWVTLLDSEWSADLEDIRRLYPQLGPPAHGTSWSCPFRVVAFVGGSHASFAPIVPNPIEAAILFNRSGVHPFIESRNVFDQLGTYETTNGACFYPANDTSALRRAVDSVDASACSLRGTVTALTEQEWVLSSVESNFDTRCASVIDTPDMGGRLRSGETLPASNPPSPQCGLLPRVRPFLSRVAGTAGRVTSLPLTTFDDGGDCHMGRAFALGPLVGRRCTLTEKNRTHGLSTCFGEPDIPVERTTPLSVAEVAGGLANAAFRGDDSPPRFSGSVQEVSFGQLYTVSIAEALASDLISTCASTPGCELKQAPPWRGGTDFMSNYSARLLASVPVPGVAPSLLSAAVPSIEQDAALWATNWTWRFGTNSTPRGGGFTRSEWSANRTATCTKSLVAQLHDRSADAIRNISLCNPPPTAALGQLCSTLVGAMTAIGGRSCQRAGDCVNDRALFYLPYQWVTTNNEYAGQVFYCLSVAILCEVN